MRRSSCLTLSGCKERSISATSELNSLAERRATGPRSGGELPAVARAEQATQP